MRLEDTVEQAMVMANAALKEVAERAAASAVYDAIDRLSNDRSDDDGETSGVTRQDV